MAEPCLSYTPVDASRGHDIYLYETPLSSQLKLGHNVKLGTATHWGICIDGFVYDLSKDGQDTFGIRPKPKNGWFDARLITECEDAWITTTAKPWTPGTLQHVAEQVWEILLQKKYEADNQNCQVFVWLLVELIRDPNKEVQYPKAFQKSMRTLRKSAIWGWGLTFAGSALFASVDGGATLMMNLCYALTWSCNTTNVVLQHEGRKDRAQLERLESLREWMYKEGALSV